MADTYDPTERTKIKRFPRRGVYERAVIHQILDEGLICHVGFAVDGQPYVIPTIYVRMGERIYLHGSPASRMLKALKQGGPACVTVTLIDGLVLARSAFHHSMNYRSVVIFGTASVVNDSSEKVNVLHALTDHLVRGRWQHIRTPNIQELQQTLLLAIPIEEASAKVRTGPPLDDEADYQLPVWAGVIPLRMAAAEPVADPQLLPGIPTPEYAARYLGPAASDCSAECGNRTGESAWA